MRVLVAGASGVVGRQLVPQLIARGYSVIGMVRSSQGGALVRDLGAKAILIDALDREAVRRLLTSEKPEAVIHQLTSLGKLKSLKNFDDEFALTNRLRTEATDYLLGAARESGVRIFVAQSYGNWTYERAGSDLKTEESPLDPRPPAKQQRTLDAIRYLENTTTHATGLIGIALRYGNFYGSGTGFGPDGDIVKAVQKRQFPIVGRGTGTWSFIHVIDAASAAIAALEHGNTGLYNIVDDDPAPVAVWLPELARILGAAPPRRVPVWLGRLFVGAVGVSMMNEIRGVSNAKAKRELLWQPSHKSWRQGFRADLA